MAILAFSTIWHNFSFYEGEQIMCQDYRYTNGKTTEPRLIGMSRTNT